MKLCNYHLLKFFNRKDYPAVEVEIQEKRTLKKGFAFLFDDKVELWYGDENGADDKIISVKQFNKNFVITNINMLANLTSEEVDDLLKTNKVVIEYFK